MGERHMEEEREITAGFESEPDFDPADFKPRPFSFPNRRRSVLVVGMLSALVSLTVLPPLINVNRYRRQIAGSISRSLGRPVHMDAVTLTLLPIPGFTLQNFVVGEDPAFGWEPVLRANSVRARLRLGSLWRRRVEFSRITFNDTSLNLVRRADGRWNIESILLQASKIEAAPTTQTAAGEAPRFPYIEATGARVNVKMGLEKMPITLTEGEFALWLPKPEQWRLRLEGHPARTDTTAIDTGVVRVQGTLGHAGTLAEVPMELNGEWSSAPLGGVSKVVLGEDAGARGEMELRASVVGTAGKNQTELRLELRQVRRSEFFPARTLDVDVACRAEVTGGFLRLDGVRCAWPPTVVQGGSGQAVLTGQVRDLHSSRTADLQVQWMNVPVRGVMDLLREASSRVSGDLDASGTIQGRANCCSDAPALGSLGSFSLDHVRSSLGDVAVYADDGQVPGTWESGRWTAGPFLLELGGPQAATLMLQGNGVDVRMRLTGMVIRSRLLKLSKALPQFGDGMEMALPPEFGDGESAMRVDLVGTRNLGGRQVWTDAVPAVPITRRHRSRR